jgi:hypothetical protein
LWSNQDTVSEAAQKELTAYMIKTMCSTYDLVDEDFIHEKPLISIRVIDQEETMCSTDDLLEEGFIHVKN